MRKRKEEEKLRTAIPVFVSQVSETEINGQFESVCESVFSEVESQAMEALDLPGSFRTRSHSYLRAIQAGYSQDDDCLPSMTSSTVTSTLRSTTGNSMPKIPPKTREGSEYITSYIIYMRTYVHMYSGVPLSLRDAGLNDSSHFFWLLLCVVCLFLPLHTLECSDELACHVPLHVPRIIIWASDWSGTVVQSWTLCRGWEGLTQTSLMRSHNHNAPHQNTTQDIHSDLTWHVLEEQELF